MTWEEGTTVEICALAAACVPMLVILGARWVRAQLRARRETDQTFR